MTAMENLELVMRRFLMANGGVLPTKLYEEIAALAKVLEAENIAIQNMNHAK